MRRLAQALLVAAPSALIKDFSYCGESLLETVKLKANRQSVLNLLKVEIVYKCLNHLLLHLYCVCSQQMVRLIIVTQDPQSPSQSQTPKPDAEDSTLKL